MALPKLFQRIFWHNNTTPAINEDNLNAMSKAIDDIDDRLISVSSELIEEGSKAKGYAEDSEAWSQGTRNGVPVDSDDPTYHNNSKWHAEHPNFNLGDLNDVAINGPTDGDAIVYNSTEQKWKNGPADVGLFVKNGILCCRYQTD